MEQPVIELLKKKEPAQLNSSRVPKLQTLILHKLADIMFHDNPLANSESIQNVLHALKDDTTFKPSVRDLKDIITKHGRSLANIFKPMPLTNNVPLEMEHSYWTSFTGSRCLTDLGSYSGIYYDIQKQALVALDGSFERCEIEGFDANDRYCFVKKKNNKEKYLCVWDLELQKEVATIKLAKYFIRLQQQSNYLFIFYDKGSNGHVELYDTEHWKQCGTTITTNVTHCISSFFTHPYLNIIGFRVYDGFCLPNKTVLISYPDAKIVFSIPSVDQCFSACGKYLLISKESWQEQNAWHACIEIYSIGDYALVDSIDLELPAEGKVYVECSKDGQYYFIKWFYNNLRNVKTFIWRITDRKIVSTIDNVACYESLHAGAYYLENGTLMYKRFADDVSSKIRDNCYSVYLTAQNIYLVTATIGSCTLYSPDTYQLIVKFQAPRASLSPNDAYVLLKKGKNRGQLYLLNIFKHTKFLLSELLALILLEKNKGANEVYDPVAQEVVKESKNPFIRNFAQWQFFEKLTCCICKKDLPENELILPCGHAQIHQHCLDKWNADKRTGCPVCATETELEVQYLAQKLLGTLLFSEC